MPVIGKLENLSALIKGAAAAVALLPGVAALAGVIEIPPTITAVVQFVSVFVGLSSIFATILLSPVIFRASRPVIAALVLILATVGAGTTTAYFLFAGSHVVRLVDDSGQSRLLLIPLYPSEKIHRIVDPVGGDYEEALQTSADRLTLERLMQTESAGTAAIMITLLILAHITSISAVMLGAWRLASSKERRTPAPAPAT